MTQSTTNGFIYNGRTYIPIIPAKFLFKSSLIYGVHTRGDIFAMDIESNVFTVVRGDAEITQVQVSIGVLSNVTEPNQTRESTFFRNSRRQRVPPKN